MTALNNKPHYVAIERGDTWAIVEQDARVNHTSTLLVNLPEHIAKAIAILLNAS